MGNQAEKTMDNKMETGVCGMCRDVSELEWGRRWKLLICVEALHGTPEITSFKQEPILHRAHPQVAS